MNMQRIAFAAMSLLGHVALFFAIMPVALRLEKTPVQPPLHSHVLIARFIGEQHAERIPSSLALEGDELLTRSVLIDVPVPSIDPVASDSFGDGQIARSSAEVMELERLQGIYKGQIMGRIARVLELHSLSLVEGKLDCVINVVQDGQGKVLDVLTDQCPYDTEVVQGLAVAIHTSSPLPPPPSGLAMGSYLTLRF
jgi:hypothetical protein